MSSNAEKILDSLKRSKNGRKRTELVQLYEGFGFIVEGGKGGHDRVFHPEYPELRSTSLPRHTRVAEYLVRQAIEMVTNLQELQKGKEE